MRTQIKTAGITFLIACVVAGSAVMASPGQGRQRDSLGFLKRAITEANAPALSSEQETQLTTLITNFKNAQTTEPNEAVKAAHDALDAAVLAGDLAAAQAQAAKVADLVAELNKPRMQALAKFQIDVLDVLKSGGQLEPLKAKFSDHLVRLLSSLAGGPPFGAGPGGGPGFRPEGGPGLILGHRPGGIERN